MQATYVTTVICLVVSFHIAASYTDNYTWTGYIGDSGIASSDNYGSFTSSYKRLKNSTYTFTNKGGGYVALHFVDFDLHPNSIVKIYEGTSTNGPGTIWLHNSSAPVYAANGPSLYVVFKTGTWPKDQINTHYGFTINYTFTEAQDRSTWKPMNIPSTGFCGALQQSIDPEDGYSVTVYRTNPGLPVHCSWHMDRRYTYLVAVPPSLDWISDVQNKQLIIVRDNHVVGSGSTIAPTIQDNFPNLPFIIYDMTSSPSGFHLVLNGALFDSKNSVFKFAYSGNLEFSKSLAESANDPRNTTKTCPYKNCQGFCALYWDVCEEDSHLDGTCDYINTDVGVYHRCETSTFQIPSADPPQPLSSRCYHYLDRCDDFADCLGDGEEISDESGCVDAEGWSGYLGYVVYGFAIVLATGGCYILCTCMDKMKEKIAKLKRECRESRRRGNACLGFCCYYWSQRRQVGATPRQTTSRQSSTTANTQTDTVRVTDTQAQTSLGRQHRPRGVATVSNRAMDPPPYTAVVHLPTGANRSSTAEESSSQATSHIIAVQPPPPSYEESVELEDRSDQYRCTMSPPPPYDSIT